jgi:hypothetical protein
MMADGIATRAGFLNSASYQVSPSTPAVDRLILIG